MLWRPLSSADNSFTLSGLRQRSPQQFCSALFRDSSLAFRDLMQRFHSPDREASRHSQTQRMAATTRAIQLTAIGIVSVPTVTRAWLINRTRCPIAKMPKSTLATRSPVPGEFISRCKNCAPICQ
jgi:hypothetical protein